MVELLLKALKYLGKNILAIFAIILSVYTYITISRVSIKLKMEPILKIKIPSEFTETNFPISIENIGKANVKDVDICWATLIKETAVNTVLRQSGVSPASPKLKKRGKIEVNLDVSEEIEKIKNLTSNVFFLSIRAAYNREVDSQPRQNTFYFMLSYHAPRIDTSDITTWRQPNFIAIQKELNDLMVR